MYILNSNILNQKNKNRQYIEAYITNKEFVSEAVIPLPLFASQNAEYLIFDQSFMLQCINMSPERTNMKPEQHKLRRSKRFRLYIYIYRLLI